MARFVLSEPLKIRWFEAEQAEVPAPTLAELSMEFEVIGPSLAAFFQEARRSRVPFCRRHRP
jgi:hypothetical protein